ncbi:MAG: hypothetical protein H7095_01235 [Pseudopedobacter sp.]|nr:hypothetical protein [Deinococcales bacterium]
MRVGARVGKWNASGTPRAERHCLSWPNYSTFRAGSLEQDGVLVRTAPNGPHRVLAQLQHLAGLSA